MNRQSAAWIALLSLAASACAQSPAPEPFPQAAVDALIERFNAHDAAGIASFYTEDAVMMPPVEFATVETLVFGDHAWLLHRDIWNANAPRPSAPVEAASDEPA